MIFDDIKGKTIENTYWSNSELCLKFTDGTSICIYAYSNYDSYDLEEKELDDWQKLQLEIITNEEYDEIQKKNLEDYKIKNLAYKKQQLAALKKELGET